MPTELELCSALGVSRITVRRALEELSRLGFIERTPGRGTFVRPASLRSGDANEGFLDAMRRRGAVVTTRLLYAKLEKVNREVAEILGAPKKAAGTPLAWRFTRLRSVDGLPMAVMNTFVARDLGDEMRGYDLETESFYDLYSRILGQPVTKTEGTVSAIVPDPETCALLDVPAGSAHLWYRSVGYLGDGSPVEMCFSIFNAAKYAFSVSNLRVGEDHKAV